MQSVLSEIQNTFLRSKIRNGDGIDQLHHMVTVFALTAFAAVIVVLEYVGSPINCWTYGENAGKHQDHVNQYCWTHSLYHYPNLSNRSVMPYALNQMGGPEVVQLKGEDSGRITFYRWGTAIFLVQALMFKFPSLLWGEYSSYYGCNIVKMVEVLQEKLFEKDRKEKLVEVAMFLHKWLYHMHYWMKGTVLQGKPNSQDTQFCICDKMIMPSAYLATKLIFLVNICVQFCVLSVFLEINFWTYGVETIESHAFSEEVPESSTTKTYFPTLAICHFRTYDQGTSAAHPVAKGKWVQCILRVNIILEKMFLIEWFWLLLLLGLTIGSFIFWCYTIFSERYAVNYVVGLTKRMEQDSETAEKKKVPTKEECEHFIKKYLSYDGVFILRILAINTNHVIVAELLEKMQDMYLKKERHDGSYKPKARKGNGFRFCSCVEHHTEDETQPLTNLPLLQNGDPPKSSQYIGRNTCSIVKCCPEAQSVSAPTSCFRR